MPDLFLLIKNFFKLLIFYSGGAELGVEAGDTLGSDHDSSPVRKMVDEEEAPLLIIENNINTVSRSDSGSTVDFWSIYYYF